MTDNLRSRARGEVATSAGPQPLDKQIQTMQAQFQLAMPKGAEAAQLVRDALTCLRMNPGLAECSPASVLGSLMTCAQLGLRPGVLGHAYLLPFYDTKSRTKKAQLIIGYQGLCELGYRSGQIAGISARTVYENDPVFEVQLGTDDKIIHIPTAVGERGAPIAYYCVVHIKNGRPLFYVMSHEDMEHYRDQHATAKTKEGVVVGPWRDNFEGMAHKTCLRQLSKWMPKSTELATALEVDEGVRVNIDPRASMTEETHHYEAEVIDVSALPEDDAPQGA